MFLQPTTDFVQTFFPSQGPIEAAEGGENVCLFGAVGTRSRRNFYSVHSTKYAQLLRKCVYLLAWNFQACVLAGSRSGDTAVV